MGVGLDPTKSTKVWSVNGANDKGVKVEVHDQYLIRHSAYNGLPVYTKFSIKKTLLTLIKKQSFV